MELTLDEVKRKNYLLELQNASSMDVQIKSAARLLGYKKLPPTIEQFLTDPYYLGRMTENLYPFWVEKLKQIYPTCIHTAYPIIVVKGGIGTGKSTFSRINSLYQECRLDHLIDPYSTLQIMPGKFIDFTFFAPRVEMALSEFISPLNEWKSASPYFNGGRLSDNSRISFTCDGVRSKNSIGKDVLFYNLTELNFIPYDSAFTKLNSALKRWKSRFERFTDYFGMIIIDTSSKGDDSIADEFAESNPYENVLVINTNKWVVREHLNYYGRSGWFKVYLGDSIHQPFIINEAHVLTPEMDQDRILDVPEEVRPEFEYDLITSLNDIAGISTNTSDRFFVSTEKLLTRFSLPMYSEDVIKVDFWDKKDKLIYLLDRYIRDIPKDRILYIRYDIGVVRDNCGLSICYFDSWKVYDKDRKIRQPQIKVPVALAINRYEGDETPIYHLFEFIMDLKKNYEIGRFTCDQFASRQLLQDLEREGVMCDYLSVDRTDEAYVYTKTLANNDLIEFPNNQLLKEEFVGLRRVGKKVDHPALGSKDISDAVVGAVFSCYKDIDHAGQISNKYRIESHVEKLKERTKSPSDEVTEMIQSIY